jgi:hypothetical protein
MIAPDVKDGVRFHDLKEWPEPFEGVRSGIKTYEVRSNLDRRFEEGDVLVLREWVPCDVGHPAGRCGDGSYTGEVLYRRISYITRGGTYGLPTGIDVLGLEREQ